MSYGVVPNPFGEQVLARVHALVDPMLAARHVELVELTYRREGSQSVLRFLVETAEGITVQECTQLNHAIGAVLDEHDVIPERYCLEVASPGVDRPLRTVRDFERVLHRRVRLTLREPVEGLQTVVGAVEGVGDEVVTVVVDHGPRLRIPLAGIVRAIQEISF